MPELQSVHDDHPGSEYLPALHAEQITELESIPFGYWPFGYWPPGQFRSTPGIETTIASSDSMVSPSPAEMESSVSLERTTLKLSGEADTRAVACTMEAVSRRHTGVEMS